VTKVQDYTSEGLSKIVTDFDSGLRETINYDLNDLEEWSRTELREDLGDTEEWTSILEYYDDDGNLYDTVTIFDDGA